MRAAKFISSIIVKFKGGNGGDGCISMLSLFANEFAGPAGGDGGCGGHVVLRASSSISSLDKISKVYRGLSGERGRSKHQHGANAKHVFVDVPLGTIVAKVESQNLPKEGEYDPEMSDIVGELDEEGSLFIAARGGAGGRGNAFYLSNLNRHPRIAEEGAKGEINVYELRMPSYSQIYTAKHYW